MFTTRTAKLLVFGIVLLLALVSVGQLIHAQESTVEPTSTDVPPSDTVVIDPDPLPDVTDGQWNFITAIVISTLVTLGSVTGISIYALLNSVPGRILLTTAANIAARTSTPWDDAAVNAAIAAGKLKKVIHPDGTIEVVAATTSAP